MDILKLIFLWLNVEQNLTGSRLSIYENLKRL